MPTWTNADGLNVQFGTERADRALAGVVTSSGDYTVMIADLDHSRLPAFGTETPLDSIPQAYLPSGAVLASATLEVIETFTSGGAATLTIGTQQNDGTTIDADGVDAAIAVGALTAGASIACDGVLIGTALSADSYLSTTVGVADFTAGRARLVLKYFKPAQF